VTGPGAFRAHPVAVVQTSRLRDRPIHARRRSSLREFTDAQATRLEDLAIVLCGVCVGPAIGDDTRSHPETQHTHPDRSWKMGWFPQVLQTVLTMAFLAIVAATLLATIRIR